MQPTPRPSVPILPQGLTAQARCASAAVLHWHASVDPLAWEIERRATTGTDTAWHRVGCIPGRCRRYESTGMLGGGGRSWEHRVRALQRRDDPAAAGPWQEVAAVVLPDSPGGPRGTLLVSPTPQAPRNISGSFVSLRDGSLLYAYTASANAEDNAPSWIEAMALTPEGRWETRGTLFDRSPAWSCVSRPSFARLRDGAILATYSVGRAIVDRPHDAATSHFLHRTVARHSRDDGRSWSEARIISDDRFAYEMGNSNGTRTLVLASGRIITNVHCCKPPVLAAYDPFQGTNVFNEVMGTYLLLSDDHGRSWRRVPEDQDQFFFTADDPYGRKRIGFWEIAMVEDAPDQLLMYGRNASGFLYETRSTDGGQTWSPLARTDIPYPIAPPNLTMIPGTRTMVLLANPHVSYTGTFDGGYRSILATHASDDRGASWYGYRELEYDGDTGEDFWSLYSYPDFLWHQDRLHVVYSRRFTTLYHTALTPAQLTGG